jgi:hypothetical protein
MANDKHIKNYTAADIEKYHRGLLSQQEMHDLEKAALDDPFLADALEGYTVTAINASQDITDLKNRLAKRTAGAIVIPVTKERSNTYRLLRVAAMIIFIAGAGLLIYQFGFNKKSGEIARAGTGKTETVKAADPSVTTTNPVTNPVAALTDSASAVQGTMATKTGAGDERTDSVTTIPAMTTGESTVMTGRETAGATVTQPVSNPPVSSAPSGTRDIMSQSKKAPENNDSKKDVAKEGGKTEPKEKSNGYTDVTAADKDGLKKQAAQQAEDQVVNKAIAANRKTDEQYYRSQSRNTFRGRVTDAANVGVPFANVTNVQDNAGTYTDANGNFILTSPDSVLTVNIRSIGFENSNTQLRNDVTSNKVVLQDDRKSLSEVVVSNQKPNTIARAKNANVKLEEPEPADGWDNYDVYLANNLNVPEEYKTRQSNAASVELSFEVDKYGEPINIRIEKSLCPTCDKEAIRLVKDGPKWKRKARKGRTTVTINF